MGTTTSQPSPLAPTFERMATWDIKATRRVLQDYKDKDMDFGLDAQGLAELLRGDKDWAESILDAFGSPTGIVNALAFICGACLVSSGPALEKTEMIFDALDFDSTEKISMDEMTIAFLCSARGFCVIAGVGIVPSDEGLESVTLQAYRDLNKGSAQSIAKAEFTKWVIEFASGAGAPPTREVSLQNALEQFRVVPPAVSSEKDLENNPTDPFKDAEETIAAEHHDEVVHADAFQTDCSPPQETKETETLNENDEDIVVEQSDPSKQSTDIPGFGEPEHVTTEEEQQPTNCSSADIDAQGESTALKAETLEHTLLDSGGEDDVVSSQEPKDDLVDLAEHESETATTHEPEQQPSNASHGTDIETIGAQEDQDAAESTGDNGHLNVVGIDEPPQESEDEANVQNADENNGEMLDSEATDVAGDPHDAIDRETEPDAGLAELEAEAPQQLDAEAEGDEDAYEQDFAQETPQETPRLEPEGIANVAPDETMVDAVEVTDERGEDGLPGVKVTDRDDEDVSSAVNPLNEMTSSISELA
ncbi:hypothetical protein PHYBOEH_001733 [Phytophthora boehmeriae]|uniref:Uncharacterized protein n=1 Tax=Phytophthora boehmeriae TaxID=109152 RepID=A0A8T1X5F6_9STRA|nr:hypothetical protein PHYBOEH_001733 [Phytophthora boehmeriae]